MILTLALIVISTLLFWMMIRKPKGIPPGPISFVPIFGNLTDLDPKHALTTLRKYRDRYGDIYSLKMGTRLAIIVNGQDTIKDILVKNADNFSNRPDMFIFREISKFQGLVGSSGSLWKEHRTFALSTLRLFGFGKKSLETDIKEEIKMCLQVLEDTNGKPYDIQNLIHANISNVTCALVFGKRFEHTDPKFVNIVKTMDENFKNAGFASVLNFIPFLKYLPGDLFKAKLTLKNVNYVLELLQDLIKEHEESYDENNIRDYVDAYIKQMKSQEKEENNEQLLRSVSDLFVAGTETTATTIRWTILYFLHYPEVQEKMRIEIEEVVGNSRFPTMDDRSQLPYCEATITEILRCANIAPLSVPHTCDKNMMYKGYTIPKNTVIIPNLDSVMSDPALFPKPEKFEPLRFIDDQGKLCGQEKGLSWRSSC
ncbi:hypothetical protein KUTeg_024375 [Tegillarca granosa]|uniref:Uncharacterized protein n=1 Tax=Tegillarca granosa TaxID=220873 RepID=A0ABQ9DX48_TEGGR|nr:hypothetical protein KUTeg_024375 [Tegillarca granosa]